MRRIVTIGLAVASLAAGVMPAAAWAGDEDDARVAIAAARAKIDAGDKAGVAGQAADIQSRARTTLDEAMVLFKKDKDRAALAMARQADALADLASSTAELRTVEGERDKLATR
ncbi:hypothetical protein [Sphingomonas montanisoli]|uniref:DUF4398 domain-containing protein n=1 Tax=Sphingomonas montanisoli TaxID=2606412 RepID=A0A5D9C6B6_9SPHN|nr:hypothetical protein [Sphingomonas montanisoli]TZG27344.1 hypothetical protein FYJ91_06970 [Sphingomonas montanisoli]